MVLGVLHPLVGFHTGLTQWLRALHTIASGWGIIFAASAALLKNRGLEQTEPPRRPAFPSQKI